MPKQQTKRGGGAKKIGRSARSPSHARYVAEQRWEKNRSRKLARHLKRFPDDLQAYRSQLKQRKV